LSGVLQAEPEAAEPSEPQSSEQDQAEGAGSEQASEAEAEAAEPQVPSLSETLTGTAKAEYAAAKILYEDGDYTGALTKLEAAYRMSKDPRLLWNMAAAEKNLRHYANVIKLIDRYLASESRFITDDDRRRARELVNTVQGFVSKVTFDVKPDGANIAVDGQQLGRAPLTEPVQLDFGRRTVRVTSPGFIAHEHALDLEGGRDAHVSIRLDAEVHEGTLRVVTDPHTTIRIDGKVMGAGMWQGVLPSGSHTVQLEGANKIPESTEVVIEDGASRAVTIHLRDVEPTPSREIMPTWLWVTTGVAAAAAVGTGAYFIFKEDKTAPAPEEGSWGILAF
jgi:hypothetical protein